MRTLVGLVVLALAGCGDGPDDVSAVAPLRVPTRIIEIAFRSEDAAGGVTETTIDVQTIGASFLVLDHISVRPSALVLAAPVELPTGLPARGIVRTLGERGGGIFAVPLEETDAVTLLTLVRDDEGLHLVVTHRAAGLLDVEAPTR